MVTSEQKLFRRVAAGLGVAIAVGIVGIGIELNSINSRISSSPALTSTPVEPSTGTSQPLPAASAGEATPTSTLNSRIENSTATPTLIPSVTPAVDERNTASTDKEFNFFNNTMVDMAQGQYQGYAALQVYLSGEQDLTAQDIVSDNKKQENWVSHGVLSDTMNITGTSSVDTFYSSGKLTNIDLSPNRDASDRFQTKAFTLEANEVLTVLEKQAEAWTDFETGNLKVTNPQEYYKHLTKNLTLMLRSLGVSLIDKVNNTFEMVINNEKDIAKFVQSDFETGLITRVTEGVNPEYPNPKGVGTKDVYHMNKFGNPGVVVNAWKETYKFDEKSGKWVLDKMIPVGNVANGGKDAKLFFFSQWEKRGDNHWLLNLVLIPDNPALNMLAGFKGWVDGLYATAPLPFGKQGSVLPTPRAVLSPTPTPTTPGVTETPGGGATRTPAPPTTHPIDDPTATPVIENTPATPNPTWVPNPTQPGPTPNPTEIIATPVRTPAP